MSSIELGPQNPESQVSVQQETAAEVINCTFSIPVTELNELKALAALRETTVTAALREAIQLDVYIQRERTNGNSVYLGKNGNISHELLQRTHT